MHEREPTRVCPSLPPFPSLTSLSFPHTQPGSCTKSIGHLALLESSHRGLYVPGESEAGHKGKVTGGGEGRLREGKAGWRPLSYRTMEEQDHILVSCDMSTSVTMTPSPLCPPLPFSSPRPTCSGTAVPGCWRKAESFS